MNRFKPEGVLTAVHQVRGGVLVAHHKETASIPVRRIEMPHAVQLPMQQHIGAPCTPTVKVGERVTVGQVVGDSDAYVSVPIHASISGKVKSLNPVKLANGRLVPAVTIESDGLMELCPELEPPVVTNREEMLAAVRASGLVGLGGAGFPSHVKLGFSPDKNIDTLIINAAECEPYITVDYRECVENFDDIFGGIEILRKYLGFKTVVIAIEDNKPEAIDILSSLARRSGDVSVMALKSKYPQGAEKMMIQSVTGRRVPVGKLPADVGCVVMNVASCAFVYRYLMTGKPLVSRTMTVAGDAIKSPANVRVPIGIDVQTVVNFCGGFTEEPYKLLAGGPMMGSAITDANVPVIKSNNAILAFTKETGQLREERACIHCGRCAEHCPMSLVPTQLYTWAKKGDAEMLSKNGMLVCMECGCCSYSCPANKPLVQYMRLGKEIVREASSKK